VQNKLPYYNTDRGECGHPTSFEQKNKAIKKDY